MVGYLGVHQSLPVVDDAPRCHADGHNLTSQGAAQGVVPHGLAHMLHHARVCATSDDPRTCRQHVVVYRDERGQGKQINSCFQVIMRQ